MGVAVCENQEPGAWTKRSPAIASSLTGLNDYFSSEVATNWFLDRKTHCKPFAPSILRKLMLRRSCFDHLPNESCATAQVFTGARLGKAGTTIPLIRENDRQQNRDCAVSPHGCSPGELLTSSLQ